MALHSIVWASDLITHASINAPISAPMNASLARCQETVKLDSVSYYFSLAQQFFHFSQGPARVNHIAQSESPLIRPFKYVEWLYWPISAALPLPLPERLGPTAPVFLKQWENPNHQPSPDEVTVLEKYNALDLFQEKGAYLRTYPKTALVRRLLNKGYRCGLKLAVVAGLVMMSELSQNFMDWEGYVKQPVTPDNEVQLIIEVVPFPHLAIRIDHKIYSYGQSHMSVLPMSEYLLSHHHQGTVIEVKKEQVDGRTVWQTSKDISSTVVSPIKTRVSDDG